MAKISRFSHLARALLHYWRPLGSTPKQGAVQRFSGPAAPPLPLFLPSTALRERDRAPKAVRVRARGTSRAQPLFRPTHPHPDPLPQAVEGDLLGARPQQLLQLAALEHLHHDVGAADELALHIELGDRRPVAIFLDARRGLPGPGARRPSRIWLRAGRESRLRGWKSRIAGNRAVPFMNSTMSLLFTRSAMRDLGVTHWSSPCSALRFRAAVREALPLLAPRARHRPPGAA